MHSGKTTSLAPRPAASRRRARTAARLWATSPRRQSVCTPAMVQVLMREIVPRADAVGKVQQKGEPAGTRCAGARRLAGFSLLFRRQVRRQLGDGLVRQG